LIPCFYNLIKYIDANGWENRRTLTVDKEIIVGLLRKVIAREPFDEKWYLQNYPDVREAVSAGKLQSGRQHYIETGYFENRLPGLLEFDVDGYLRNNPDLSSLSKTQAIHHFVNTGHREGRSF